MVTSLKYRLLPWLKRKEELQGLALAIEQRARELTAKPISTDAPRSLAAVDLLRSANDLLAQINVAAPCTQTPEAAEQEHSTAAESISPEAPISVTANVTAPSSFLDNAQEPPMPVTSVQCERSPDSDEPVAPHPLVNELIKLRDWLQTVRDSDGATPERALNGMDRKLRYLLEREGFVPLDDTGPFSGERQEVLETTPTDDANLHDHIYATVRSGYLFHNRLFRSQQVVIYVYNPASPQQP